MGILYMSIRYTDRKLEGVQFFGRFGVIADIRREIGYAEDSCTGCSFSVQKTISGVPYIFSTRSFPTPEGASAYFSMALEAKDAYEVSKTLSDKMIKEVMSVLVLPKVGEDPFLWMTTGAQLWYEMRKCNAGDKCMISHKYHPLYLLVAIGLRVNSEFIDFWGEAEELDVLMEATHLKLDNPVEGFCCDQLVTEFTSYYGLLHLTDRRSFVLAVRGTMEPYSCLSVLNSVSKELSSDTRELDMVEACSDLKCLDDKMLIYPGKEPRQGIVYAKINRAFGTDETYFKFTGHLTSLKVITDAVEANEHLLANSNTNTVGFTNSSVISVNGSKFYLYIHKVSSIHKASSGTFILVFGENIEENERMGLLTQLATCKLYGPVRDLVLRANGGGEYTDESEDCRLHLNYCFVARDDTILMECVDFIGDESEVWDISSIGKEWIKSSSQGLRTSKEETHEKGEYDFYAFLLKDDIGCFVSSSFLPEDRDGNVQLEDNFVFNHLVVFVKKVVDAVKSVHDPQVESLGARVKEIMAKTNDELRRMMSSDE